MVDQLSDGDGRVEFVSSHSDPDSDVDVLSTKFSRSNGRANNTEKV